MEIEEICRRAKAEGLSYGQYVFVHAAELAGRRPKQRLRPGERSCRRCGRAFLPMSNQHRFCRAACRVAYNQEKRKKMKKMEETQNGCTDYNGGYCPHKGEVQNGKPQTVGLS